MAERASFARDGFLHRPAAIDVADISRISDWIDQLWKAEDRVGGPWKFYDGEEPRRLQRIEKVRGQHEGLHAVLESEGVARLLESLFEGPAKLFKDKIHLHLPGTPGHPPHQDSQAGWQRYCRSLVTLMISIDATTEENGCLELVRARHREGLLGPEWEPLDPRGVGDLAFEKVSTGAGDILLFDSFTPHRSGRNRTAQPRRVWYLTFNPAAQGDHYEEYFADKRLAFPPDVERIAGREYRYRV
jgi:ectoine hydroxylase-related dioxygenase (phytanoyl-CoA dioxygenase family)